MISAATLIWFRTTVADPRARTRLGAAKRMKLLLILQAAYLILTRLTRCVNAVVSIGLTMQGNMPFGWFARVAKQVCRKHVRLLRLDCRRRRRLQQLRFHLSDARRGATESYCYMVRQSLSALV